MFWAAYINCQFMHHPLSLLRLVTPNTMSGNMVPCRRSTHNGFMYNKKYWSCSLYNTTQQDLGTCSFTLRTEYIPSFILFQKKIWYNDFYVQRGMTLLHAFDDPMLTWGDVLDNEPYCGSILILPRCRTRNTIARLLWQKIVNINFYAHLHTWCDHFFLWGSETETDWNCWLYLLLLDKVALADTPLIPHNK